MNYFQVNNFLNNYFNWYYAKNAFIDDNKRLIKLCQRFEENSNDLNIMTCHVKHEYDRYNNGIKKKEKEISCEKCTKELLFMLNNFSSDARMTSENKLEFERNMFVQNMIKYSVEKEKHENYTKFNFEIDVDGDILRDDGFIKKHFNDSGRSYHRVYELVINEK